MLLLVASFVVFLLHPARGPSHSGGQEKAPLYLFEPEIDLSDNYGTASGILIN